jgi:hypothetical protein
MNLVDLVSSRVSRPTQPWLTRQQRRLARHGSALRSRFHYLTAPMRILPEFVIIGAQKCGTSTLYALLTQHPDVLPALEKEVHFFDSNYHKGLGWYRAHFASSAYCAVRQRASGRRVITGEASPYYLVYPFAPARLRSVLPQAKLIVLLRNPVDRAYSHYQHQVARGRETLTFEEALRAEPQRLEGELEKILADETYTSFAHVHYSYRLRGLYADQLDAWLKVFPREQILVLAAEALFADTRAAVRQALAFLDLPDTRLDLSEKRNTRSYAKMDPATREELVEFYRPHNQRLYDLLGTSFEQEFGWDK